MNESNDLKRQFLALVADQPAERWESVTAQVEQRVAHALLRLVGKELGVPASAVTLAAGATARLKTLHVAGDPDSLEAALARLGGG